MKHAVLYALSAVVLSGLFILFDVLVLSAKGLSFVYGG